MPERALLEPGNDARAQLKEKDLARSNESTPQGSLVDGGDKAIRTVRVRQSEAVPRCRFCPGAGPPRQTDKLMKNRQME
jgi:hypothetical protein